MKYRWGKNFDLTCVILRLLALKIYMIIIENKRDYYALLLSLQQSPLIVGNSSR